MTAGVILIVLGLVTTILVTPVFKAGKILNNTIRVLGFIASMVGSAFIAVSITPTQLVWYLGVLVTLLVVALTIKFILRRQPH